LRHIAYAGGWKKFEPLWDWVIRAKRVTSLLPMLEAVLTGFGSHPSAVRSHQRPDATQDPRRASGDQPYLTPATGPRELDVSGTFSQLSH
jgi:hypothetical protein